VTKKCVKCKEEKEIENFDLISQDFEVLKSICKQCLKPLTLNEKLTRYNLSSEDFTTVYNEQKGKCLICAISIEEEKSEIDYDYKENKIKSILCKDCIRKVKILNRGVNNIDLISNYISKNKGEE
jgi:hypothetical protein